MQHPKSIRRLNRDETKAVAGGTTGSGFVKPAAVPPVAHTDGRIASV